MKMRYSHFLVCALMLLLLAGEVPTAVSVTCNVSELSSCAPALLTPTQPSAICCKKLKEQQPCLCQYIKDPKLKKYLSPGNGKRVASSCCVPVPNC